MSNVTVYDNGKAYLICVNEIVTYSCDSLKDAWKHIVWMYIESSKNFTVGKNKIPVISWMQGMYDAGFLNNEDTMNVFKNKMFN